MIFMFTFVITKRKIHNMDYSKVKFVTPSVSAIDITKGKVYPVLTSSEKGLMEINDDVGYNLVLHAPECHHLDGKHWIPCREDGTPLTNGLTELEAEMLAMLEAINEGINTMDFSQLEGLQSEIDDLIKKAEQ